MNNISVCMIIKDEEQNLDKCLSAVKPFVSEIVIVDTGSKDNSREIARSYTDRIYDFAWCNDFSTARNFSVEKASNDWILILDADEIVEAWIASDVEQFMSRFEMHLGRIRIKNILEEDNREAFAINNVSRLYNKHFFHYEGSIHEQLIRNDSFDFKRINVGISIIHYGYLPKSIESKAKLSRNLKMLEQELKTKPQDVYYNYQAGKTEYLSKNYNAAAKFFRRALDNKDILNQEYAADLLISLGYTLINNEEYSKALEVLKYTELFKDLADYHFIAGLIYMNNGYFDEAVRSFINCTSLSNTQAEGVNSYKAYYNIGVIYECLGQADKAKQYYKKCGSYQMAVGRLKILG